MNSFLIFPFVILCLVPIYPWLTLPGSGLNITMNLLTWATLGLWGICLSILMPIGRRSTGMANKLILCGLILLNMPALWTPGTFIIEAIYRLAATTALALTLWILLKYPIRGNQRNNLYLIVVVAALIQSIYCFWESIMPGSAAALLHFNPIITRGRATGTFGQANLAGSFLATGVLCALWLSVSLTQKHIRWLMRGCVVVLCGALLLSESRTAWLGAAVGGSIILWLGDKTQSRVLILATVISGLLIALGMRMVVPEYASIHNLSVSKLAKGHATLGLSVKEATAGNENIDALAASRRASNRERMALVRGAWELIASRPMSGHGIGSFESTYPFAMRSIGVENPFPVTVAYPHNEILYVWSEGGIIALGGLLFWLLLWGLPFSSIASKCTFSRANCARGALTIPLMVHVMTEYPFYLSVLHAVLMILLLWAAIPITSRGSRVVNKEYKAVVNAAISFGVILCCFSGMLFSISGLQSVQKIHKAEETGVINALPLLDIINPYAQPERRQFDLAVSDLMNFNKTGNIQWLYIFQKTAGLWLKQHNDPNLINAMMKISEVRKDTSQSEYWRLRGCLSFQSDPRFRCSLQPKV